MLKKIIALIAFSGFMMGIAFAAGAPRTGVVGSMHDINFAPGYTDDANGRVCIFCHTPHNAQTIALAPLWNHAPSPVNLPSYSWAAPGNSGIAFAPDPLIGPSRLCMACHDGVTAVDAHGAADSTPPGTTIMTSSYVDGIGNTALRYIDDLAVTHPIGFLYNDAFTARGATELVTVTPAAGRFIDYAVTPAFDTNARAAANGPLINDKLYGGFVTCASCHEVHNTKNAVPDAGHDYNYFVWAKEEGSALCLSCHIK